MSDYPPPPSGDTDPSETVWHAPPPPGGEPATEPEGAAAPPPAAVPPTPPPAAPQPGYAPPQPGYTPPPQPGYAPPQPGYAAPPQPGYAPQPAYGAQPGYAPQPYAKPTVGPDGRPLKSKMTAGLLGIFLGSIGVHRFYLGYAGIGIAQIVVTIVTCGIGAIWGLIEGILILTGSPSFSTDAEGRPLAD